jgi:hypothetical protein
MIPYVKRKSYTAKLEKKYGTKFLVLYGEARALTPIWQKIIAPPTTAIGEWREYVTSYL